MLKSSSSEKKLLKPLKNCFFGPNLHRKGVIMDHAQDKKKNIFLVEITKADHQLSESFYFIKISYVLTELWIFFLSSVIFSIKKVSFPAKTAVNQVWTFSFISLITWCDWKTHHIEMTTLFPKGRYSKRGGYILDFVLKEEPESEKFEVELFCFDMFSVAYQ